MFFTQKFKPLSHKDLVNIWVVDKGSVSLIRYFFYFFFFGGGGGGIFLFTSLVLFKEVGLLYIPYVPGRWDMVRGFLWDKFSALG